MKTKKTQPEARKELRKDRSVDSEEAEIQDQFRLGLEIMKKYRETFEALAKYKPDKK